MKVFPSNNEKLISSVIFSFILGCIAVGAVLNPTVEFEQILSALVTLVTAFSGAYFAFKLNHNREVRAEEEREAAALDFAMLTLVRQLNAVSIRIRELEKYEPGLDRSFNMPSEASPEYADLKQAFSSLAFILKSDEANLLMDISIEQERFEQAMGSIYIRNEHYSQRYQPIALERKISQRKFTEEELEREIGEFVYRGCIKSAEDMSLHLARCEVSILKLLDKLKAFGAKEFKGRHFVGCERTE